jgi:hypothetical protein
MKKTSFLMCTALAGLIVLATGCQDADLQVNAGPDIEESANLVLADDFTAAFTCGDLIISDITITDILPGNHFNYKITFKNIGQGTVYLEGNQTLPAGSFYAYLSKDTMLNVNVDEPAASGTNTISTPSRYLYSGETHVVYTYYHPSNPVNISEYQYLFIVAKPQASSNDCVSTNNTTMTKVAYKTHL